METRMTNQKRYEDRERVSERKERAEYGKKSKVGIGRDAKAGEGVRGMDGKG